MTWLGNYRVGCQLMRSEFFQNSNLPMLNKYGKFWVCYMYILTSNLPSVALEDLYCILHIRATIQFWIGSMHFKSHNKKKTLFIWKIENVKIWIKCWGDHSKQPSKIKKNEISIKPSTRIKSLSLWWVHFSFRLIALLSVLLISCCFYYYWTIYNTNIQFFSDMNIYLILTIHLKYMMT